MKICLRLALAACATLLPSFALADDEGIKFFEQKIRPVLVQHCYSCHSAQARDAKKLQGALFLDTAAGIAAGGESGATLVKGKSADSLLLKALKYDGLEMPPAGKLSDEIIADFAKWIDLGAPDPRAGDAPVKAKREIVIEEGRQWWSFQPLKPVKLPDPQQPVDGFIRQAQQAQGLHDNHPTTREKLIRRAYFDLIGLPPTPEQVAAFVNDSATNAFEKVVDELLANTAYGERWGRHWLDAARFAESGGYEFDGFRPGAYHYRDWVIRALNDDLPYDEFVRMQLAGDLLKPDDFQGAAATGFLVAGPYPGQITAKTVERIRYDQLDDMLMTMGGSMLGLTLGCVRCHEHKYDPIPHQDYYALAASLARTAHGSRTLDTDPPATQRALEKHQAEHEPLVAAMKAFAAKELPKRFVTWRNEKLSQQPEAARWQALEPVTWDAERSYLKELPGGILAHDGLTGGVVVRRRGQKRASGNEEHYRLTFETHQKNVQALRLDAFTDKLLPQRGPGVNNDGSFQLAELTVTAQPLDRAVKDAPVTVKLQPVFAAFEDKDQPLANAVDGKPNTAWIVKQTAKKDNAAIFEFAAPVAGFVGGTELIVELKFRDLGIGRLRVSLSVEQNPATWAGDVAPQHVAELRAISTANGNKVPENLREPLVRWFAPFDAETAQVYRAVREHTAATPRPKLAEVYTTIAGGQDVYFLRRGEVDNKQGQAKPGFIQVLHRGAESASEKQTPPPSDPRIELGKWMTDVERGAGSLLARVIVNRVWQHHFGEGIVGTPNDFGMQGDRPSHPELLEFLADELIRGGWKLKTLHRLMMLSATYQQSGDVDSANLKIDPTNRYLWHFRPRRLEAETIRDALLAVGGNLDKKMYGASVLENTARRSVYLRVKRSELIPIMTMFDAPEPTQSIGERIVTTVPTQALAMMNSTFVRQQAELLAARISTKGELPTEASIDCGFQHALGRSPSADERQRMWRFVEQQRAALGSDTPETAARALVEFCQVLLCLNEFVYVD
ncbi:MAG: PSD1 domain-containing protein [Planctomycetaceae bacterium]|nr:PSD1 domain-containing protein [Planctomycetaceae bacterium]